MIWKEATDTSKLLIQLVHAPSMHIASIKVIGGGDAHMMTICDQGAFP